MDLDLAVVLPAALFTALAVYFATSLILKKIAASSAAAASRKKKPQVGYGDEIPPSRALGQQLRPEPEVSPLTETPAPAEEIQDVPAKVEAEPVPEPTPEVVLVPDTVPEPISAHEVAAVSEAVPEPELEPELKPEPVSEPEEYPEEVEAPEPVSVYDPEPEVESEPEPEVVALVEESLPELIPCFTEEIMLTPGLLIETHTEAEPEIVLKNDVAAAEDQVHFTPGKKQSKFETLMTEEEVQEEQRAPEQ